MCSTVSSRCRWPPPAPTLENQVDGTYAEISRKKFVRLDSASRCKTKTAGVLGLWRDGSRQKGSRTIWDATPILIRPGWRQLTFLYLTLGDVVCITTFRLPLPLPQSIHRVLFGQVAPPPQELVCEERLLRGCFRKRQARLPIR